MGYPPTFSHHNFLSECSLGPKYVAFLVWAIEDSEGTDQNEATSIQIDSPIQLTAVKRDFAPLAAEREQWQLIPLQFAGHPATSGLF